MKKPKKPLKHSALKHSHFSKVNLIIFVLVFAAIGAYLLLRSFAAGLANVTVTNTTAGTIQTQLSTNNVYAGSLDGAPGGQAKFNTLKAPYVRVHCGDDGTSPPCLPENTQNVWNFTSTNQLVNDVFASGQQPLMNPKFAPDWQWTCANKQTGQAGDVRDQTFQQYAQFLARMVDYYNKGSMTTETGATITNPAGATHRIIYWEPWNEPDLNNETPCAPSSGVGLTPQQYLTMWNAVTAAMLAEDSGLKFVGPATAGAQFGSSQTTGNQYVDLIMTNAVTKPTAISFHGYGYWDNTVADKWIFDGDGTSGCACGGVTDIVSGITSIHNNYPALPIWLTEVNVNADWGNDAHKRPSDEFAAAWWGALFQRGAPLGVGIIHQYDVADGPQFGLVDDQSGNPYIAYYVFQLLNQYFPQGSTILSTSSDTANVLTLAVRTPSGHTSVLVVNRQLANNTVVSSCGAGGVPVTVTVNLPATPSAVTLRQIDKNNVNCTSNAGSAASSVAQPASATQTVTFPGYGIAVLDVTPASGPTANAFVSPNGSDTGANCKRFATAQTNPDAGGTTICKSLNKAYQLAFPGDIVEIENGSYTAANQGEIDQSTANGKPGTNPVIFQAAAGATVTFNNIDFGNGTGTAAPSYITLKNVSVTGDVAGEAGLQIFTPATNIEVDNVNGGAFYIRGAQHVLIKGGDWGPCDSSGPNVCQSNTKIDSPTAGEQANDSITIDGATIHDFSITNVNDHFECMFLRGGNNITIQNSHFYNCEIYDIFLQPNVTSSNWTIQNNWFGKTMNGLNPPANASRSTGVTIGSNNGGLNNVTLRNNSFAPGQSLIYESGTFSGFMATGNIFGIAASCFPGITYSYNIWVSGNCGSSDVNLNNGSLPYINTNDGAGMDYHLSGAAGSTIADNLVPTSAGCAPTDIDGVTRPADTNCDAGSDERTSGSGGSVTGDLNGDGHVTILDLSILLSHYGQAATAAQGDINSDGTVTILDLSIMLSHYGT